MQNACLSGSKPQGSFPCQAFNHCMSGRNPEDEAPPRSELEKSFLCWMAVCLSISRQSAVCLVFKDTEAVLERQTPTLNPTIGFTESLTAVHQAEIQWVKVSSPVEWLPAPSVKRCKMSAGNTTKWLKPLTIKCEEKIQWPIFFTPVE